MLGVRTVTWMDMLTSYDEMTLWVRNVIINKWAGLLPREFEDWLRSRDCINEHNEYEAAKLLFAEVTIIYPAVKLPRSKKEAIAKAKELVNSPFFNRDRGSATDPYFVAAPRS